IHRFWQSLGFRMNKILAWFITFNFINITWIFFRAKDFESAMKVLGSMFSFDNVVLPNLEFINNFKLMLREIFISIGDDPIEIISWNVLAFVLVLVSKNSMSYFNGDFRVNYKILFLTIICFIYGLLSVNKVSEFLYFNF
ncbi:MBOAT family protein, partial [Aliarcobacter butzleri]|nr:MBOAT family protein [Aliarcobacter butzleri]